MRFGYHVGAIAVASFAMLVAGCDPPGPVTSKGVLTRNTSNPPLPPPPPGSSAATPAADIPPRRDDNRRTNPFERPVGDASPAAAQPASTTTPTAPDSAGKPTIRLSVGTALPQTLPDGTQVGVGVEYKLTSGALNPSAKYVWVVESRQGQTAMEVKLSPQGGELLSFLPIAIRPGDGPFKAWIEEVSTSGTRVRVSNVEELK
jgi:hypothetical protein